MTSTSPPAAAREVEAWHREAQRALNARDFRSAHELCLRILKVDPGFADAMFLLGMIAAEHANFGKAAEVIERAIALDPTRAEYHAHLGRCLVALLYVREAHGAANRALALSPDDALTLDTIGVVLTRVGAHEEAVRPFRLAVAKDPNSATYRYNLGAALQFIGDVDGARNEYRRALVLQKNHYRAWSSLAQVARRPFDHADLAHIEAQLGASPSVDAELQLCHALAKHYEDEGHFARAFQYLKQGKARKCAEIRYSIATDRALFAAVQEVCTPEFLSAGGGSDSREPIFIVGMPRTGTTLVERILSSHPDVFAAGELTNFALCIKRATRTPSNLVLDVPTLEAAAHLDWRALGDAYVESTRPRTGRQRHFIDKMPLNFFYAGFIARALPRAKIVCLRRHALDACLSNYRQLFATQFPYYNYSYDLLDTGRYCLEFDALMSHWRRTLPDQFIEIQYEAVVADVETQARRLVAFCGLDWHPDCVNFHENAAPVATASSVQVRQPIYNTAVDRWRRYENELQPLKKLFIDAGISGV